MKFHDLHIHTHLSLCSEDPGATAANYLCRARELGLEVLGFTDHMWDVANVPLPSPNPWYRQQDFARAMSIRREIPRNSGIKVLVGVETEFAQGVVGISPQAAGELDFVLVPHSHIHMLDFVRERSVVSPRDVAAHMLKTFEDLVSRDIATIVAHPFFPLSMHTGENLVQIYRYLPDGALEHAFGLAQEHRAAVEVNLSIFEGNIQAPLYQDTYLRMLSIAKRMGCKFSIGSDSHSIQAFDETYRAGMFEDAVAILGLTDDNMVQLAL